MVQAPKQTKLLFRCKEYKSYGIQGFKFKEESVLCNDNMRDIYATVSSKLEEGWEYLGLELDGMFIKGGVNYHVANGD